MHELSTPNKTVPLYTFDHFLTDNEKIHIAIQYYRQGTISIGV